MSVFELDEAAAKKDGLLLKDFQFYSKEWADFILANRANGARKQIHEYDIVHGPIARRRLSDPSSSGRHH